MMDRMFRILRAPGLRMPHLQNPRYHLSSFSTYIQHRNAHTHRENWGWKAGDETGWTTSSDPDRRPLPVSIDRKSTASILRSEGTFHCDVSRTFSLRVSCKSTNNYMHTWRAAESGGAMWSTTWNNMGGWGFSFQQKHKYTYLYIYSVLNLSSNVCWN